MKLWIVEEITPVTAAAAATLPFMLMLDTIIQFTTLPQNTEFIYLLKKQKNPERIELVKWTKLKNKEHIEGEKFKCKSKVEKS